MNMTTEITTPATAKAATTYRDADWKLALKSSATNMINGQPCTEIGTMVFQHRKTREAIFIENDQFNNWLRAARNGLDWIVLPEGFMTIGKVGKLLCFGTWQSCYALERRPLP